MAGIEQTLVAALAALDSAGIPYLLTGGLAVSYYGEPRLTHDIDLVVRFREADVARIVAALAAEFDVAEESARAALREGSAFNAVHIETGDKVDLWVLTDDDFEQERFNRRVRQPALGLELSLPTPEDVIVSKLAWYRESDSDKHLDDARGVLRVQAERLDRGYIEAWCRRKGLLDLWLRLSQAS